MNKDTSVANGAAPLVTDTEDADFSPEGRRHRYTLPTFRYVNIVLVLIFIDGVVSVVLWLVDLPFRNTIRVSNSLDPDQARHFVGPDLGPNCLQKLTADDTSGNSDYFVDNITHFHLKESVFDLALAAAVKVILHAPLISYLETVTYSQIQDPFNRKINIVKHILHLVHIMFSLAILAYTTTKGALILNAYLNDSDYKIMHPSYNALTISALAFTLIEFGVFLFSYRAMRQLKVIRVLHLYNDDGQEVDKEGNPIKKKVDIKRLITLAKPEAPMISIATLCLVVASGSQILAPRFFGKVIDAAQHSMAELNETVLTLFIIYIVSAVFAMARSWLFTLAGHRVVARLRRTLFQSIIKQEVAFYDTNRTGELCNRLSSDTQVLQNAVTVNLSMLVRYLLQMIGSLILMFTLNPALTGVLLAVVPVVSLCAVQYGKYMKTLRQTFQDRLGDAGTQAEESLSSIRTVRTFSGEIKSCAAYNEDVNKSYNVGKKLSAAGGIFEGGVGVLIYGSISLVLWYGGKLVNENQVTPGILTAFLLYTLQVAMAFALMSALYGDFMQAVGASIRIFDLLDRVPKVPNEGGDVYDPMDGRVEFKSIHFTYPSRPETTVIKGVSFTVEPGQMVALVGPSGGGKSTLVNLIERFYDPDSGTITLGGHDIRDLDPQWFRQKISMVSQEPTLFACSIKDNIAYGRDATMEEVIAVAKEANAHEFISTFEKGYETLVGERGVRLSGGQKQRIAIARALIMNPVLLLLDEATSALDAESEHLVQEAVDRAMKGRTVVVIAHRLSTVRDASQVIVIDKGVIAEKGTHDELLAHNGVYKRLILRQLTAGSIVSDPKLVNINDDENVECENADLLD